MKVVCEMAEECRMEFCEHYGPHEEITDSWQEHSCREQQEYCSEVDKKIICVISVDSQVNEILDEIFEFILP